MKRSSFRLGLALCVIGIWSVCGVVWAADAPAPPPAASGAPKAADELDGEPPDLTPRRAIFLSMEDAVRLTLQNNVDIKVDSISPLILAENITMAKAKFDWTFVSSYQETHSALPSSSALSGAATNRTDTAQAQTGFQKNLITGGNIQPGVKWERDKTNSAFTTINPSYTTNAFLTISQPVMRNAGLEVNLSGIHLASNFAAIARYTFKQNVISILGDMQGTYWDLVFAIEDLDVKKKSLRLTKDTLYQTRAQVEAGLLAPIEITRVRADVASQEEVILLAQKNVEDKEDLLRRFINQRASKLVEDVGVVPLQRTAYQAVEPDLDHEVREALFTRPDYISAKLIIENCGIQIALAKNAKLPVVDLSATLSLNGLGDDTGSSFSQLATGNFPDWTAGVSVQIPIGNRLAKAEYLQARLAKDQSIWNLKNLEYDIIVNVKQSVRQVRTNLKSIPSTRLARELAEERLKAEEEKFNVGTALILDVLDAQTKLAQAESAERQAVVDYNKSLILLEKNKGTLLERNRIHLSDNYTSPGTPEE